MVVDLTPYQPRYFADRALRQRLVSPSVTAVCRAARHRQQQTRFWFHLYSPATFCLIPGHWPTDVLTTVRIGNKLSPERCWPPVGFFVAITPHAGGCREAGLLPRCGSAKQPSAAIYFVTFMTGLHWGKYGHRPPDNAPE